MILSSLSLTNYKKYTTFSMTFEEGLTGIIGRNGSGKSTIFDAITFALYGEMKTAKENIKNSKASEKENVIVGLTFEIEGMEYKVTRELRGKAQTAQAKLYQNDSLISDGVKPVNASISKLVGMSKEAFMHTVFASQKELTALSGLKNEDRKKIIRKLLGLEKIDKIEQEIRTKLTDLNRDIKSYNEILLSFEAKKEILDQQTTFTMSLEEKSKEVQTLAKQYEAKQKELATLVKELEALQKQKEELIKLQSERTLLTQNKSNHTQNLTTTKSKLQTLQTLWREFEKEKPLIEQYVALEAKLKTFQFEKEKKLKKEGLEKEQVVLREQYTQLQKEIKELEATLTQKAELTAQEQALKSELEQSQKLFETTQLQEQTTRAEIAKLQGLVADREKKVHQIQGLGKASACPTCTRPLLDEYDKVINALQNEIAQTNAQQIAQLNTTLKRQLESKQKQQEHKSTLEKALNERQNALKNLSITQNTRDKKSQEFFTITAKGKANNAALEEYKELSYDETAHQTADATRQSLEPKYKELIGTQSVIKEIPILEAEITKIEALIVQIETELKAKELSITSHTYDEKLHTQKSLQNQSEQLKREAINKSLREAEKIVESIKGEIKTLQSRVDTDTQQRQKLQTTLNDKNDYEKLKLFMAEFKNKINAKISPRISQLASEMYSTITKGKYQHIEVSDEFDFFIYDDGVRHPIERFSGGEIDLANLVLRIAISKTLAELNGSSSVGFLAFDEVFGSQDEERRMQIMEAFHTIKEQYRQIFLISHESEIKEMFERVVEL